MKRVERIISFLLVIFLLGSPIFISIVNAFDAPRVYIKELNINKTSFNAGDSISGDFLMWNTTDGIVTDLDYKISLIKNHQVFGGKIFPVSSQIYPNGTYRQSFSYAVPENIASGSYIIFVRLYTKTGMPLNWEQKDIVVSGNNNLLRISNSKLMQGDNEFQPMAGINFDSKENPPAAAFSVFNPSAKNIEFDLRVTVYNVQSNMKELKSFSVEKSILNSGKMKNFSIALPRYEVPGTYLAKASFFSKNILVSSEESFRWVIKGQSARVLKVESDKNYFQKDKSVSITVDVIGPADGSFLEGANLSVSIFDQEGKNIASETKAIRLGGSVNSEVFDIVLKSDAITPLIEVKVIKDGKELDSYSTKIQSTNDIGSSKKQDQPFEEDNKQLVIIIISISLLIMLVMLYVIIKFLKSKKFFLFILFLMFLGIGLAIFNKEKVNKAFIDAAGLGDMSIVWQEPMNDSSYNFGEAVNFSGDVNISMCVNGVSYLNAESYICDKDEANCVFTGDFLSVIPKGLVRIKEGVTDYVYVLDAGGRVMKYKESDFGAGGTIPARVAVLGEYGSGSRQFKFPESIFYSAPYIYVADTGNDRIVRFDPSNFAATWQTIGPWLSVPMSIFYDSAGGYFYVAERGSNNRVVRFKIDGAGNLVGGTFQAFGNGVGVGEGYFRSPGGVFYDSSSELAGSGSGYIYVGGGWGSQIIRFKAADMVGTWEKIGADSLTTIRVDDGGSGYASVPNVVISGGGAVTDATATAVLGTGADSDKVVSITVDTGGMGYISTPTVSISGGGAAIDAIATASNNDSFDGSGVGQFGNPKEVYYDSGTGYIYVSGEGVVIKVAASEMVAGSRVTPVSNANWTFLGGFGTGTGNFDLVRGAFYDSATGYVYTADEGNYRIVKFKEAEEFATATAIVNPSGVVTSINVNNKGKGYISIPIVMISGDWGGTGATAIVDKFAGNKVQSIAITNGGSGYTSAPTVAISKIGAWEEIDFNETVSSHDFFPYRIDTTIPVSFTAPFALGPGGEAFAKVIVRAVDVADNSYIASSTAPIFITTPPPTYTISGNVFNDTNKNKVKDGGEINYPAVPSISVNPAVEMINALADGTYTISNLPAGTYTVSYASPPPGYSMVWPSPPNLQVTVGPLCNVVDLSTGGSCAGNNVINLNFAISNSRPWIQTYGLDIRIDNGFDNPIPATADVACGGGPYASGTTGSFNSPGIIFSGDESADFGQEGFASSADWKVGGGSWPEVFESTKPLRTSTQSLLAVVAKAGITVTELGDCSAGCNLSPQKGFYHTSGDMKIDKNENFNNGNHIIVSDGTIRITNGKEIKVGNNATVIFSARDIIIDSSIGASPPNSCPVPAGQLQGIFSADDNIIVEGNNNDCSVGADKMLNVEGTLIANATRGNGSFQNNRDLCGDNPTYPSITIKARPDFILNSPGFLSEQNVISHEETL